MGVKLKPSKKFNFVIKRLFDVIASLFLLMLTSPIIILTSFIIWAAMGLPIFFIQPRLGYKGNIFNIYKFRTMRQERNEEGYLLPDKDRLTCVGKILRKTTLDELPELINVLKGEMSAVGPRPLLVDYRDLYTPEQWRRHEMRPGMAGPVLAGGRNTLTWEEKFERDLWYVNNWSLWLDVKIIFQTAVGVLKCEGVNAKGHVTMQKFTGSHQDKKGD